MAPERFTAGDIEPSSDIYALACVLYQCLTGEPPFPGSTLEQVAVGHMVAPPPHPSEERDTIPAAMDRVIETGLAKQTTDRYTTAVEMAAAARQAITEPTNQPHAAALRQPAPVTQISSGPPTPAGPALTYPTLSPSGVPPTAPPRRWPPPPVPPPVPSRPSRKPLVLIGALVGVALLIAGGVFAVLRLTQHGKPTATASPSTSTAPAVAAAVGDHFTGTYRADYGPGTDLEGKPTPGAPTTTATWGVRSTCGPGGCVATASVIGSSGLLLVSNLVFDQVGGTWVAVGLATAQCNNTPAELWVVFTLQPRPDGTLSGDTTRATTNSGCVVKRTVTFTRTGDVNESKVPDPATLPPRAASPAQALHGRYHEALTFTTGNVIPGQDDLTVGTDCLRAGDRCMSLFHAPDGIVTLMFANNKWTRNEQGTAPCQQGGTANITVTAEYPLPEQLKDPIPLLTGRGTQSVAPGSACPAGGDFTDRFERTGD
jgi:hypothetical protein